MESKRTLAKTPTKENMTRTAMKAQTHLPETAIAVFLSLFLSLHSGVCVFRSLLSISVFLSLERTREVRKGKEEEREKGREEKRREVRE